MCYKILKLIYDYSINCKLVDCNFIDKLIEIVTNERGLETYVKNVEFTSKLDKEESIVTLAAYDFLKKNIIVDYDSVKIFLEHNSYYDSLFTLFEKYMFRNISIVQTILHELEHAYQSKQLDQYQQHPSIEQQLIKASFVLEQALKNPKIIADLLKSNITESQLALYISNYRLLYKQSYQFNPTERLAQINSYKIIGQTLKEIQKYIPNLYEFEEATLTEELLNSYPEAAEYGGCPTQVYLHFNYRDDVWKLFPFYHENPQQLLQNVSAQYNLNDRLTLGLPIKQEEYEGIDNWLHTKNKYIF